MANTFTKEQQQAIDFDSGNILVSASAGSGKTSVMIERLTRLVVEGKAKVSEIMAVTFTEASAFEMKERLKAKLTEKINAGNVSLEEELNDVRTSDISTLDSFCSRLVRTNFFEIGVAPDYEIVEGNRAELLKAEALNLVFKTNYEKGGEFLKLVDYFASGRSDDELKNLILKIYNFLSTEPNMEKAIERYLSLSFDRVLQLAENELKTELIDLKNRLNDCISDSSSYNLPQGKAYMSMLLANINLVLDGDIYQLLNTNVSSGKISFDSSKDEFIKDIQTRVKDIKNEFCALYKEFSPYLSNAKDDEKIFLSSKQVANELFNLAISFKNEYDRLKGEENLLDFADLEHFALKILENESVLENLKNKYKYIFVDEYQDINSTQEEIISKISKNNCFMVGDEKQSIYGFRGCRPEFFNEKINKFIASGENCVKLNNNFRSAENVLNFVNTVFDYCMTENRYGLNYRKDARLIGGSGFGENKGRAELHILTNEKTEAEKKKDEQFEPRIYDLKEEIQKEQKTEDDLTVSLVADIINREVGQEYYDAKSKQSKKINKRDIAILTRDGKGKRIDKLVKGLIAHGIDVSAQNEEDVCEFPEVQNVINFLRLIDCFYQDVPLIASLKGVMANCTENELADIVDYYTDNANTTDIVNKYNFTFSDAFVFYIKNATGELRNRLVEFVNYVDKLRFVKDFKLAGEIIEQVEKDFSIFAYLYAEKNGDVKVNRLQRLIDFCYENELSISKLIKLVDSGDKKITLTNGGNDDSVKIMTIHSSKGLEFPVVICCGLEYKFNDQDLKKEVYFDRELGIATKYFNDEERTKDSTLFRFLVKKRYLNSREREEMRLFYVALTRATYAIHLVATPTEDERTDTFRGANRFIDYIPKSIVACEEDLSLINEKWETKPVIISQENQTDIEKMKKIFNYTYPYMADTTMPLKSSVTAVNSQSKEKEEIHLNELFSESETKTDTERGILAHRIMQYYDFGGQPFDSQISKMIERGIVQNEEIKILDIEKIKDVAESKYFTELKDKKIYREQPFIFSVKANDLFDNVESEQMVLIQGVIDLLVIDNNGCEVVDYKYSQKNSETLKKTYKKQLEIYAKAVEEILKIKVKTKKIVSLLNGEETIID